MCVWGGLWRKREQRWILQGMTGNERQTDWACCEPVVETHAEDARINATVNTDEDSRDEDK